MLYLDPKSALLDPAGVRREANAGTLTPAADRVAARPAERVLSPAIITGLAQVVEALLLTVLGFAIYRAYLHTGGRDFYVVLILSIVLVTNIAMNAARTHRLPVYRAGLRQMGRVLAAWSGVMVVALAMAFLFRASDQLSRVWIVAWYAAGAVTLVAFRLSLRALVLRWTAQGRLKRRTVVVGGGKDAEALIDAVRRSAANDVELIGVFDDRFDDRSPAVIAGTPKLGRVAGLVEFARRSRVDLVIVALPPSAEKRVLDMLKQLWVLPVDIRLSAHTNRLRFRPRTYSFVGKVPFLDVADRPIADWDVVAKWMVDRIVGGLILLLALPVMALVALAVKLDSKGPALFKQKRYGFNNELIEVYKFRSMYADKADAGAARLVTKGDPRVTRVGRFIRKTSLDELPQLFNVVFKGNLSLVGPRPHAVQAKAENRLYDEVVDGYFARHRVKPGITGWAQINGWRGETDAQEKIQKRVEHDLFYIENWSVIFDLMILLKTPFALLKTENAY